MTSDAGDLDQLIEDLATAGVDRQAFLRQLAALGIAAGGVGSLAAKASAFSTKSQAAIAGRPGGKLTLVTQGVPDSLDPSIAYSNFCGLIMTQQAYCGLVAFKRTGPTSDARVTPVLAAALPHIS